MRVLILHLAAMGSWLGILQISEQSESETQCASIFHASIFALVIFAKVPLARASHMPKTRLKGWRNRLHLLTEGDAKSHCKGDFAQGWEKFVAIFSNLPQTLKGKKVDLNLSLSRRHVSFCKYDYFPSNLGY